MSRSLVSRRKLLISGVAGAAGIGLAGFASTGYCLRRSDMAALPLERLDVALFDIIEAERVAIYYRGCRSPEQLQVELLEKEGLVEALAYECPEMRRACVRTQARVDFRVGDIVLADRFVVARSECVLAALRQGLA